MHKGLCGILFMIVLISGSMLLSGCGGRIEPGKTCTVLPSGERDCGGGGVITFPFMNSSPGGRAQGVHLSGFDASLITVDLSSSTMPISSTSGFVTLQATLDDDSVHSSSFQWVRSGDDLYLENSQQVNGWLDQFDGGIVKIDVNTNIVVHSVPGPNMYVAEIRYGGTHQAGITDSWYENGGGSCGGGCQQR